MQLNAVEKERQNRFKKYMDKTYKKTASLMANSCKAVSYDVLAVFVYMCSSVGMLKETSIQWHV